MGHEPLTITDRDEIQKIIDDADQLPSLPCDPHPIVNGLTLRKRLGRRDWNIPQSWGCCGWSVTARNEPGSIIVSADHQTQHDDGVNWIHASISRGDHTPTYDDLKLLHHAVFGDGWAYQVFAPPAEHINIHEHVLHLFGRADGQRALPDFGRHGTI